MEETRTTLYMDTFNRFNRYQQELTFLNQKYASFFNQRDEALVNVDEDGRETREDTKWFKEFQDKLKEFGVEVDRDMVRRKGIMEILYPLTEEQIVEVLEFFWIENSKKKNEADEDTLNNILLEGFLSDFNRYKAIKKDLDEMLSNDDTRAIIYRIWKLIRKDLLATLKSDKSLLEAWEVVTFEWKKKFWKRNGKWEKAEENPSVEQFDSKELHEKFTTSVLTFHEIEKLYQKYNYVFTMRDIKDLHVILSALRSGEMILMTWDTWSWKTELSLLIADLYLDEVYTDKSERKEKRPIFVTGNSDTDFSDLTLEKIMTSKNSLSDQNDAIFWSDDDKKKRLTSVFDTILKSDEVQEATRKRIDATDEKKAKLKEDLKNFDLFKLNIFTEYHMQWIVKAMENGVPLILDEINGIGPEVLLWLNHYFTRRVGQTISLWNGFDPITIKKWFCIICTWNDKNENSKINRYQWRYNIDESLLNRMYRICKWYHKQEVTDYGNENRILEGGQDTQLDYMNENELYGVILMLCFNKKWNNKDIDEISNSTILKKMINTQTVGFDLIKESFKGKSVNESKEEVFNELRSLAKFVHYVQEAYQWGAYLDNASAAKLNSSPFSMRQLVSIIRDWKSDTKSLWYHLYNVYVRQIPVANDDRYWVYRIAQEVWFIRKDDHIENRPEDIKRVTQELEKNNTEEFHMWSHTRNAHIKETKVDDALLESHLIITKQDFYKEYFWRQFWNISDEAFQQQIDEEKKELVEMWKMEIVEDSVEDLKINVEVSLDAIATYLEDEDNGYCKALDFTPYSCLKYFCNDKDSKWKYSYIELWEREDKLKEAHDILIRIVEKFQNGDSVTDEGVQELTEAIQELKKLSR